jgi:hypothetical protein
VHQAVELTAGLLKKRVRPQHTGLFYDRIDGKESETTTIV